ncbi:hypothetical protein [Bacillus cereus]|uniref:hypothetical protein n=1 Tax=Bacillus cereus TaxID=1396 RepID=UPI000B4B7B72|nr:hypothetical protein [Bacillus cereus]
MKEKVLRLLNEYFDTDFFYEENTIYNPSNRPVFHYSLEQNEIRFIGRGPTDRKREKWNYIYGLLIALRNEPIKVHDGQLSPFIGIFGKDEEIDTELLLKFAAEYDQYLKFLDANYVYNLVQQGNKAYIMTDDLSFQVHLRTNGKNWLLGITKGTMKTKKVPHGKLIEETVRIIEEHINTKILTHTFDAAPIFPIKFPYLTAYFEKRLKLPLIEAESLAKEIEKHTGISAGELEYELSASRKKLRLQSIHLQSYTIGGKGAHYYEFPSSILRGENRRIYFKKAVNQKMRNNVTTL